MKYQLTLQEQLYVTNIQSQIYKQQNELEGTLKFLAVSHGLTNNFRLSGNTLTDEPPENENVKRINIARDSCDIEAAIIIADQALKSGDNSPEIYTLKAACLGDLGKRDEALKVIDAGLKIPGIQQDIIINERGFQKLLSRDYSGWSDWEYRIQRKEISDNLHKVNPDIQEWNGEPDSCVLCVAEKGLGDTILFSRYLRVFQERNCKVQFLASVNSTGMVPLFNKDLNRYNMIGAFGGDDKFPLISKYWIALESLPKFFKDIPEPFEFPMKWNPDPKKERKLQVGLCWAGMKGYSASKCRRPEDLELWKPVTKLKNKINFVSLQLGEKGPCKKELPNDSSVLNTVKIATGCDLVISTDTSVVHMCASAGVPTWVPYHKYGYWPWIPTENDNTRTFNKIASDLDYKYGPWIPTENDNTRTVWYPTVKLYQQTMPNEWSVVFYRIASDLDSLSPCNRSDKSIYHTDSIGSVSYRTTIPMCFDQRVKCSSSTSRSTGD